MTLIDGIGDEVVQSAAVLVVVVVAALAWWSTNARPDRYRTVLVMRSSTHHPVTVSIRARNNLTISNTPQANNSVQESTTETISVGTPEIVEESSRDLARVIPLQEMDSIVDADMAMMDNNRLHFYRRIDSPGGPRPASGAESTSEESESPDEGEPPSNAQIREMDSIVSAMEADVSTRCDFFTRSNEPNSTLQTNDAKIVKKEKKTNLDSASVTHTGDNVNVDNASVDSGNTSNEALESDSKKILIKLKYLNDTLKEVEGSLDELLKDFKWRHFSVELSSECLVRLIYKGRVLDEAATLRACGLTHRAVVHCLVHPKRNTTQQNNSGAVNAGGGEAGGGSTHELVTERAAPERVWDLENILMTLVSVALTVVWFFRCEYSNMFTASASVALFGLTVFYSVAIFGLYLSDTFHFDRRPAPAQPVPAN